MPELGPPLQARLLGLPELVWRNELVMPRSRKGLALLFYLALHPGPVSRLELSELFWGGKSKNLRQELYRLRKLPGAQLWLHDEEHVSLNVESDLQAFERAVNEARYADALAYHRGPLLAEFELRGAPTFSDWLQLERHRVDDLLRKALHGQLTVLEKQGDIPAALDIAKRLLSLDPLDETSYRTAMRLYYQRGEVEKALDTFQACRRMLASELGVEPLGETLELAQKIEQRRLPQPASQPQRPRLPLHFLRPPKLVGREAEWAKMEEAWQAGKTIFISGPAGVGKSRLMLDFAHSKGSYLLMEGRPGDKQLPYSSTARAMGRVFERFPQLDLEPWAREELARLFPQYFPDLTPPPPDSLELQPRFMQAVWQLMDHVRRLVASLPADDFQHYDPATNMIASSLTARFIEHPIADAARMLIAFRQDEIAADVLEGVKVFCQSGAAVLIELAPLEPAAVKQLLENLELPRAHELYARIHRYTGGYPMFIMEVLRDLHVGESTTLALPRPQKVEMLIHQRLESLPTQALRLTRAVAVAQPEPEVELLASVLDADLLTVAEGLGELEEAQILDGRRFAHDLLYETVRAHMPSAVLTFLHRQTAEALEVLGGEPARVAKHWLQAGELAQATKAWLEAGRRYHQLGLHEGAGEMLALAIQHAPTAELVQKVEAELQTLPERLREALTNAPPNSRKAQD